MVMRLCGVHTSLLVRDVTGVDSISAGVFSRGFASVGTREAARSLAMASVVGLTVPGPVVCGVVGLEAIEAGSLGAWGLPWLWMLGWACLVGEAGAEGVSSSNLRVRRVGEVDDARL